MCKSLITYKHTNYKYEIRGNWGERFNPRLPSKVVQSKVRPLAFMLSVKYANLKMCDQLHKFVICKCEIWDLGRKWEVPDRGGLVESCWDECEIRALLCSVWSPSSSNFSSSSSSSLGPALSYTSQFSSFVSYLLYLQREDRSFLQFHTSSFLQFELSLFFSLDSIRAPPTFQLPIGILCYIVIFLNPLSPNTHQKGNGWIRSVPNMEKLLWRRSEKLMPPVSYLPFWQTDCFQWWSRLKSVVLHSPALLSSTEDPKFPNMADLTNWKRALLLDSINITTAAL